MENFQCIQIKKLKPAHISGKTFYLNVFFLTCRSCSRLNVSDPETLTVFTFILDGKVMKAIHHTGETRLAHVLRRL